MDLEHQIALARRIAAGGWITAGFFNSATSDEIAARDAMRADGRLVASTRDGIKIFELTTAGITWLHAEQGA